MILGKFVDRKDYHKQNGKLEKQKYSSDPAFMNHSRKSAAGNSTRPLLLSRNIGRDTDRGGNT